MAPNKANDLATLINKRDKQIAQINRIKEYVTEFAETDSGTQLRKRETTLNSAYAEFNKLQDDIEDADKDTDHEALRKEVENRYYYLVATIEDTIVKITVGSAPTPSVQTPSEAASDSLKLPPLHLPKFDGHYANWLSFFDTFNSMIHLNEKLNDCQKFHYLKGCLSGEASRAIESLAISQANYNSAYGILVKRYNNQRLIVQDHVYAILRLPQTTKASHSALRALANTVKANIEALRVMKISVDSWSALIIPIITEKLDYLSNKEWQATLSNSIPTLTEFFTFLERKCELLEAMQHLTLTTNPPKPKAVVHVALNKQTCGYCKSETHKIYKCEEFKKLTVNERIEFANAQRLCRNCLGVKHTAANCYCRIFCLKCKQNHHTLLHLDTNATNLGAVLTHSTPFSAALLSTVAVKVRDNAGRFRNCRALLDMGSQGNLVTRRLINELKITCTQTAVSVIGVHGTAHTATKRASIAIKSNSTEFEETLQALVVDKISDQIPAHPIPRWKIQIPEEVTLADPDFHITAPVDILLGAEVFWKVLQSEQIKANNRCPHLQKTELGWVIGGSQMPGNRISCGVALQSSISSIQRQIAKLMWEIEPEERDLRSAEELECEHHYVANVARDTTGRFTVGLPFKANADTHLGNSREMAIKRFSMLEAKLNKKPQLKEEYCAFINEYIKLNHMKKISPACNLLEGYYLPHHAVIKESSTTTRLRVVFDASAKTTSKLSLNDILMVGPCIQQDLFSITLRLRTHLYVMTADIAKMYRQINIDPSQRKFQRIVWRESHSEPIETYELQTVTYGTASASWLATRTLQQLANHNEQEYPRAAKLIKQDFYMDDLLTGGNDLSELICIRDEILNIMKEGGFELRKWAANNPALLPNGATDTAILDLDRDHEVKALGLVWDSHDDKLKYSLQAAPVCGHATKRTMVSFVARIFDPLGLINPLVVTARILIQKLWMLKLDWDCPVPDDINEQWQRLTQELDQIPNLNIPRGVISAPQPQVLELHGFADASQSAYGAAVYLRYSRAQQGYDVRLLCARSRVAPIKTISIPRLELCGALLLTRLVEKIKKYSRLEINHTYLWTDSTIVLAWLKAPANKWHTFVAHRVAKIQEATNTADWHHIRSEDNPADIVSRGAHYQQLKESALWWEPYWLKREEAEWPVDHTRGDDAEVPEAQYTISVHVAELAELPIMQKCSSFLKLQRIIAYVMRFVNQCRRRNARPHEIHISCDELRDAEVHILRHIQMVAFQRTIADLKCNRKLAANNDLLNLNPFLGEDGLLRVGGRLANALNQNYAGIHPIILPAKHQVTKLIITREHERLLHAGPQDTLYSLRQVYWPVAGRNNTKQLIRQCVKCFRANPKTESQIMGDLPAPRVSPSRPFSICGVDYAGPITIKLAPGRCKRTAKAYLAFFICFSTKAVHLEVVSDCSTESFLAALKRFLSRRGCISEMHSDNGTNFIGARNELQALLTKFESQSKLADFFGAQKINWKTIPARSPHRGGLWEAGIKQAKKHIIRVVGAAILTFEELYTLCTQIEACLNSRPIAPLSSDPNDLLPLSPGHFLIGDRLLSYPEPDLTASPLNRLSRWQHVQQMTQHFWRRWQREYLNNLQQRTRWMTDKGTTLTPGALVLLKDDQTPPLLWRLGRIESTLPGRDHKVRTVTVKTSSGVVMRAANRVCPFPSDK